MAMLCLRRFCAVEGDALRRPRQNLVARLRFPGSSPSSEVPRAARVGRRKLALVPVARHREAPRSLPPRFGGHDPRGGSSGRPRSRAARRSANRARWPAARAALQTHKPPEIRNFLAEALAYPSLAHGSRGRHACVDDRTHIGIFVVSAADILVLPRRRGGARRRPSRRWRARDRFVGSRRSHLVGVSHSLRRGALARRGGGWLDELEPLLECYPVVRPCDVPSHGSERAVETLTEHADHLASAARRPILPHAGNVWAATLRRKAARGATSCFVDVGQPRRRARRRRG